MLVGKIKVKLQSLKQHKFTSPKLDLKSLEKEVQEKFYKEVEAKMETINENQCAGTISKGISNEILAYSKGGNS